MKDQWDRISRENAFFGVLSREGYENAETVDVAKFWKTGRGHVESFMTLLEFSNTKAMKMLEIGCGLGRMTHQFSKLFEKVYAVDVSQVMLKKAQGFWGHLPNVDWILGDGQSLKPIASESVDFVFSFWVFQHIPDSDAVLHYINESERVLKKDGTALLQFRVMAPSLSLARLKYFIFTRWPKPAAKYLIRISDTITGHTGIKAKFAREYDAWRGSALRSSAIEAAAARCGLKVVGSENLGRQSAGTQSRYYIFRKLESRLTTLQ